MSREWAVVAGATGALGSAIADVLASRDLEVLRLSRSGHDGSLAVDLRDEAAVASVSRHVDGPVRALVHVAGPPLAGGVEDVSTESVLDAIDVKVNGLLRLVRSLDRRLTDGSRIVAITGHLGYDPVPASVTAGVANAALAALVRQLARAYGPRGITCHAVAPGPVESPRVQRLIEHLSTANRVSEDVARDQLRQGATVGRFATPTDVAWAVSTLLDSSAALMNGSTVFLDGGRRTAIP